jgi:alkylation response protein AidB-like acyl-CoA dehydrogenase
MDFSLNDEQRMVQESVRKFAREKILPYARDWDRQGFFVDWSLFSSSWNW